jgi:hypothetical protein
MNKKIVLALFIVLSSKYLTNGIFVEPSRGNWCDLETGRVRCTEFCEEKGYDTGFCHQGRMTCNCYNKNRTQNSMQHRPHPKDEKFSGYAEVYENLSANERVNGDSVSPRQLVCNMSNGACNSECKRKGFRRGYCNAQKVCVCQQFNADARK